MAAPRRDVATQRPATPHDRRLAPQSGAGMSERTQSRKAGYVRAVRLLAEHYKKLPDKITEDELRRYFPYIKNDKKWSRTGITLRA
jgi:hypothetical protein